MVCNQLHLNSIKCISESIDVILNYITTNKHIKSQLDGLVMSNKCGDIDNNHKVIRIHECFDPTVLERGSPGELRNFSHKSRAGTQFPEPCDIHRKLTSCHAIKDKAWIRHLLYEYIHPFCDGTCLGKCWTWTSR